MIRSRTARGIAALFALTLLGAACSGDDDDAASTDAPAAEDAGAGRSRTPRPRTPPRSATPTAWWPRSRAAPTRAPWPA